MRTLLISYYPKPNPNLIEHAIKDSGIKSLTFSLHARYGHVLGLEKGLLDPNRVLFGTNSKE